MSTPTMVDPASAPRPTAKRMKERLRKTRDNEKQMLVQATAHREGAKKRARYSARYKRLGVGILGAGVATMATLYLVIKHNAPLTQRAPENDLAVEKQDWRKVLPFLLVVFMICLALPYVILRDV